MNDTLLSSSASFCLNTVILYLVLLNILSLYINIYTIIILSYTRLYTVDELYTVHQFN